MTGLVTSDGMREAAVACLSKAERAIDAIVVGCVPLTELIWICLEAVVNRRVPLRPVVVVVTGNGNGKRVELFDNCCRTALHLIR